MMSTVGHSISTAGVVVEVDSPLLGEFKLRSNALDDEHSHYSIEVWVDEQWRPLGSLRVAGDGWQVLSTTNEVVGTIPGPRTAHGQYEIEAASKLLGGPYRYPRAPESQQ